MHKAMKGWFRILLLCSVGILWIVSFGLDTSLAADRGPDFRAPVTLAKCISAALANNPDVTMARWEERAMEERIRQARGRLFPGLKLDVSYDWYGKVQRVIVPRKPGELGVFDDRAATYGIGGRAVLFRGGRGLKDLRIAQLEHTAAVEDGRRSRAVTTFAVAEAFYRIVELDSLISATRFSRRALDAHRGQTEDRRAVGKATGTDLLRIGVRIADLDQTLIAMENDRTIAASLLLYRMGADSRPGDEIRVVAELEDPDSLWGMDEALKRALADRADYRAARLRTEAARQRLAAAKSGRWPEVAVTGGYGGRSGGAFEFDETWTVGLQAGLVLFSGGATSALIREQQYALRRMEEAELKLRSTIVLEVKMAYLHLQEARHQVETVGVALAYAQKVFRIDAEEHRLGKGTIADLLDAQTDLLRARTYAVQARVDRALAAVELRKAIGGEDGRFDAREEIR